MAFDRSLICGDWAGAGDNANVSLALDDDGAFELHRKGGSVLDQLAAGTLRGDWSLAGDELHLKVEGRLSTGPAISIFNHIPHIALLHILRNWTGLSTVKYAIERLTSYELWIKPEQGRDILKFDRER